MQHVVGDAPRRKPFAEVPAVQRALHILDKLDLVALGILHHEAVVPVFVFAGLRRHRHSLCGQVVAEPARILGFEADLNQFVIGFARERRRHLDILAVIHLEHGDIGRIAGSPVPEDLVISQHTRIEFTRLLEVVGLDYEVGNADNRRDARLRRRRRGTTTTGTASSGTRPDPRSCASSVVLLVREIGRLYSIPASRLCL